MVSKRGSKYFSSRALIQSQECVLAASRHSLQRPFPPVSVRLPAKEKTFAIRIQRKHFECKSREWRPPAYVLRYTQTDKHLQTHTVSLMRVLTAVALFSCEYKPKQAWGIEW